LRLSARVGLWLWASSFAACVAGSDASSTQPLPWPRGRLPAIETDDTVPKGLREARVELGRLLFYDPVLSADRQTACASCHSEIWGMGDGLSRSVGHGSGLLTGPGRTGGALTRRNAPPLWNLAYRDSFFWDGRSTSLEEQALVPLRDPLEMGRAPEESVEELAQIDGYVRRFARAFPDDPVVSVEHLAQALAAFQRQLSSLRSLYDGYVAGDANALSETQVEGMYRFADLGCVECHRPPLFEREAFFDRGLAATPGVADEGRFEVTAAAKDRRAFRVPSLRNAAFTEPYFHDGSVMGLNDAVRHEIELAGVPFTPDDVYYVTRFISDALKDESREPARPRRVPSGLPIPIDGTFIDR